LEERIADLEARLPKHSIPPAMLMELEELQEALRLTRAEASQAHSSGHNLRARNPNRKR
jgi:hypothetical protein